jgi:hypothetical protein
MDDPRNDIFHNSRIPLPNGTAVFVLGICSILFSCFLIGLILGVIGLILSKEGRSMYREAPHLYEGYGLLNAGYILSIIGTIISGLVVLYVVIVFLIALA